MNQTETGLNPMQMEAVALSSRRLLPANTSRL